MRKSITLALLLSIASLSYSQVGIGTSSPNSHAVLDLRSPNNNQGFLAPALTTIQRTASSLTSALSATDNGLVVYDSDEKKFYFWKDTQWQPLQDGADAGAGTVTQINTGTGLSGGPIVANGTIALANTAVAPGTYGTVTQVPQFTVDAQGRITAASNLTISGAPPTGTAGGDLSVTYPNPLVIKLQGKAVSATAPTLNQVLKWNGTAWAPAADANSGGTVTSIIAGTGLSGGTITGTGTVALANTTVTPASYGDGTHVGQFIVDAQGRITSASSVVITGAAPTGAAGGDLTGNFPNPTVTKLQGSAVSATAPTTNQILKWNGTTWLPSADANSGGTVTSIIAGTGLSGGTITGTGTVALANTTVTPATYGDGTHVGQFIVDAQGRITSASSVVITGAAPIGAAGGDLTGTYPSPTIGAGKVTSTAILDGEIVNTDINAAANIVDTKLATITTAGKVSGNAIITGTISGNTVINTAGAITSTKSISTSNSIPGAVLSSTNGNTTGGMAISGISSSTNGGYGIFGQGTGMLVGRTETYSVGVYGTNTFYTSSGYLGGRFGVSGDNAGGTAVNGDGYYGVVGQGTYIGVSGYATGTGVYGVYGSATGTGNYGVYSNGFAGGTSTWSATSDARYKKNIVTLSNSLSKILSLRGVNYDWRTDEFPRKNFSHTRDIGVIAQEIREVIPEVVSTDKEGFYSVTYEKIVPVLIEAMKEQQQIIDAQKAKIERLEKANSGFESRLTSLEAFMTRIEKLGSAAVSSRQK